MSCKICDCIEVEDNQIAIFSDRDHAMIALNLALLLPLHAWLQVFVHASRPSSSLKATQQPTTTLPARQIPATGAFYGEVLEKRDYWYVCGYCCGVSTLSCNDGAYCKVTSLADGAYGYCSTVLETSNPVYTAVVDYIDWSISCRPSTVCCDRTSPYGFEYYFTDNGQTTRMYGCDTTGYTVEGTAAKNVATSTNIDLFASESMIRGLTSITPYPTYPSWKITHPISQEDLDAFTSGLTTPNESDTLTSNTGDGGKLEDASNLATIIGTALGVPMAITAIAVAIYFGLKQNAKRRDDSKYSQIEMDEQTGTSISRS